MVQVLEAPHIAEDNAFRVVVFDDSALNDEFALRSTVSDWPDASERPTTVRAARALYEATRPASEGPEFEPDDGLGP